MSISGHDGHITDKIMNLILKTTDYIGDTRIRTRYQEAGRALVLDYSNEPRFA